MMMETQITTELMIRTALMINNSYTIMLQLSEEASQPRIISIQPS
jgi:hypothetical protein